MLPPPSAFVSSNLSILQKELEAYKLWHAFHNAFPRLSKFSLGSKIDVLFVDVIENTLLAGYANAENKAGFITRISTKLDLLKFFVQVAWEVNCLDHKKYGALSAPLNEVGKMLGGWKKSLHKENSVG